MFFISSVKLVQILITNHLYFNQVMVQLMF